MAMAYVLINAELGKEAELMKELKAIDGVKEVYFVYGVYDIIVKIEAENVEKLKEAVINRIRRIDKVRSTLTMIVIT
ncbi:MAG: Lrp/AsnC ligand binding domain-containing protein [Nitrososphaerota archaeon]|nr:Lrp/AsnC ligand binding domain-containing protein [Nitrososphaerales archaeon]MDW8044154.1 Lrp/AsnC ligand binding domain-containing protein [Nitrososphaerota archaeon]